MLRRSGAFALIAGATLLAGLWASRGNAPQSVSASPAPTASGVALSRGWAGQLDSETRGARPSRVDVDVLARDLIDRGKAALADGDLRAGFEAYQRAFEYTPNAETYGLLGDLYLRAAVTSEATFHLRRAADLDPYNADRWLALANAYVLQTDLGAAWKAMERAKEVEPGITIERDKNNFVVRGHAG